MNDLFPTLMNAFWGTLLLYWFVSGIHTKKTSAKEPFLQRLILYWLPLFAAFYLLGPEERYGNSLIRGNFVNHTNLEGTAGLALCFTGLLTACWGRYMLGNNWSVSVQKKDGHELITRGAYSLVRHPIYTGLLLMFLGDAVITGTWRGLLGVLIVFLSFWFKLRKEEKWLAEVFGQEYTLYVSRTKALIPWIL